MRFVAAGDQGVAGAGLEAVGEHRTDREFDRPRDMDPPDDAGVFVRGVYRSIAVRPVLPKGGEVFRRRHSFHADYPRPAVRRHRRRHGRDGSASVDARATRATRQTAPRVRHRPTSRRRTARLVAWTDADHLRGLLEHPAYVPIVRRVRFGELEHEVGRPLYTKTRGTALGPRTACSCAARASAEEFLVPHRAVGGRRDAQLPGAAATGRYGGCRRGAGWRALPALHRRDAPAGGAGGAELRRDEAVVAWRIRAMGAGWVTTSGEYRAAQLVIAAGAWMPKLVPELAPTLSVVRQPMHWFVPASRPEEFSAAHCPVTLWEFSPDRVFSTLPDFGDGVKAAVHYEGQSVDPDHVDVARRRRSTRRDGSCGASCRTRRGGAERVAGVSLHEHAGPALHHRPASGARRAGRGGERVFGARVQVRDGDWRDRGGSGGGDDAAVRTRHVPHDPISVGCWLLAAARCLPTVARYRRSLRAAAITPTSRPENQRGQSRLKSNDSDPFDFL